ncbi:hypothetical protein ACFL08_00870 [Patescibacteria group bacterium]
MSDHKDLKEQIVGTEKSTKIPSLAARRVAFLTEKTKTTRKIQFDTVLKLALLQINHSHVDGLVYAYHEPRLIIERLLSAGIEMDIVGRIMIKYHMGEELTEADAVIMHQVEGCYIRNIIRTESKEIAESILDEAKILLYKTIPNLLAEYEVEVDDKDMQSFRDDFYFDILESNRNS